MYAKDARWMRRTVKRCELDFEVAGKVNPFGYLSVIYFATYAQKERNF
jgi:hypothetical protein